MDVIKLLDYLEETLETSTKVPMTGKVIINKKEFLEILEQVINSLPDEFKKAQWVFQEKDRILSDAIKEAESIKNENLLLLKREIENHDISKEARNRADEIISESQKNAKMMRIGARDYADEILSQLEKEIDDSGALMLDNLNKKMQEYVGVLEKDILFKTDTIRENIKELRKIK
jgi:cell division septum initiation protein DivIVA